MLTPGDIMREPPFASVVQHMQITYQAVERLRPFFEALQVGDEETQQRVSQEITDLEEAADQLKNMIRDHLPSSIRLPISRRDLLTVLSAQDDISDTTLKVVWFFEVRKYELPVQIAGELFRLVDSVTRTARLGLELSSLIEVLAETRFTGPRLGEANVLMQQIEESEVVCDRDAQEVLRALFAAETEVGPVDTILWDRIVEQVGGLADATKKLANRARLLLAR